MDHYATLVTISHLFDVKLFVSAVAALLHSVGTMVVRDNMWRSPIANENITSIELCGA